MTPRMISNNPKPNNSTDWVCVHSSSRGGGWRLLRRDSVSILRSWAGESTTRRKLLHLIALRSPRGVRYPDLADSLGCSERWVKQLVGELRALGLVKTVGNPAFILPASKDLVFVFASVLESLLSGIVLPSVENTEGDRPKPPGRSLGRTGLRPTDVTPLRGKRPWA